MNNQSQQGQIPEEIRAYLEGILEDGEMVLRDEAKEKMMQQLFVELNRFLLTKVVQVLPQEKMEAFVKLNESNPAPEKITEYLQQNLPNAQEVFQQAFEEFREIYLDGVDTSREKQNKEKADPTLEDIAQI
jgi:Protein of unknown function (DUF5663)